MSDGHKGISSLQGIQTNPTNRKFAASRLIQP